MPGIQQFLDHPVGKDPPRDWNELHHAAFVKDVDKVRLILESASYLMSVKDLSNWTPVHLACCGPSGLAFDLTWAQDHKRSGEDYASSLFRSQSRRNATSRQDETKMQETSCKILSLFIQNGADICGADGSLTPAHVAASTGLTSAAFMLVLFGAPIDPHRPGSPYQWAEYRKHDADGSLLGEKAEVWNMYRNLLGQDVQAILEQYYSILGVDDHSILYSDKLRIPDSQSRMTDVVLRLEYMLTTRLTRYQKSIQLGSDGSTIQLCPQCCSLGEINVMCSFFPSSTRSTADPARACVDCDFCRILHVLFPSYYPGSVRRLREIKVQQPQTSQQDRLAAIDKVLDQSGIVKISMEYNGTPVRLDIFPNSEINTISPNLQHVSAESDMVFEDGLQSSDVTMQFMSVTRDRALGQRWLSNCRANHPQCSSSPLHRVFEGLEGGNFPTRLIDVSRWAEKLVRICDSRNDSALFTALSHRWLKGQMPEWVTKKANRHTRLAWFSSAGLPKSIQDALQATAELGLRYTWIDSLCIVQDDMADWGREAAQMASIYAQAEVTIFADCASDDSKGFLGERKVCNPYYPVALKPVQKGLAGKNHPTIIRYAYDVPHTPSKEDDNASDQYLHTNHVDVSFHKDVTESHLSNRGWILQERLLSRRSLHFGRSQMYWECPSVIVSEEGHDIDGRRHQEWVIHAREALMGSSESREIGRRCWKDIVSAYSRMKLTKPSDRLPAIAGIAKVFSTYLGDKYFCGTWSDTFYQDLVWQVDNPLSAACGYGAHVASRSGVAPSWSWASVNAPVSFELKTPPVKEGGCGPNCPAKCYKLSLPLMSTRGTTSKSTIQVLGHHPKGSENNFNQQPNASVTISAYMREVIILGPITSTLGYLEPGFTPIYDDEIAPVGLAFFDEPEKQPCVGSGERILCLQLATDTVRRFVVDFMLLVVNRTEDTYARIGIAHTNIRQTSRYGAGSIFEACEPRTIILV